MEKIKENHQNKSTLQDKKAPKAIQGIRGKITLSRALFVGFIITAIIILGFQSNSTQLKAPDFVLFASGSLCAVVSIVFFFSFCRKVQYFVFIA